MNSNQFFKFLAILRRERFYGVAEVHDFKSRYPEGPILQLTTKYRNRPKYEELNEYLQPTQKRYPNWKQPESLEQLASAYQKPERPISR